MKILILSNLYPPEVIGGYELACSNIANALAKRGHNVRVVTSWSHLPLTCNTTESVYRDFDEYLYLPCNNNIFNACCSSYVNTLKVIQHLKEFQPDIVYVWKLTGVGGLAILDLLNHVNIPWAIHLMDRTPVDITENLSAGIRGIYNAVGCNLYLKAKVFSMSHKLINEITNGSDVFFPNGVEIIPGCVDLPNNLKHASYMVDGMAHFVTAGSVTANKGIDLIIEASKLLKDQNYNFIIDIIGHGDVQKYIDMAKRLRVSDRVNFIGFKTQQELLQKYCYCDAFLFPTHEREPFGFAPLEAAGCGAVPIMTAQCGAAEVLVHGVHCIKINRNVKDLTKAMKNVMDGKFDLVKMGFAGKRLAEVELSQDKCVDNIEAKLREHSKPWSHDKLNDYRLPMLMYLKHNLAQGIYGTTIYPEIMSPANVNTKLGSSEIYLLTKTLKHKYRKYKVLQFLTFGLVKNFLKRKEKYRTKYKELMQCQD